MCCKVCSVLTVASSAGLPASGLLGVAVKPASPIITFSTLSGRAYVHLCNRQLPAPHSLLDHPVLDLTALAVAAATAAGASPTASLGATWASSSSFFFFSSFIFCPAAQKLKLLLVKNVEYI